MCKGELIPSCKSIGHKSHAQRGVKRSTGISDRGVAPFSRGSSHYNIVEGDRHKFAELKLVGCLQHK